MMRMRSRADNRPDAEALRQRHQVVGAESGLQLRQRAERQHQRAPVAADLGLDLAAVFVGHDEFSFVVSSFRARSHA